MMYPRGEQWLPGLIVDRAETASNEAIEALLTGSELWGGLRKGRGIGIYDAKNARFSRVYEHEKGKAAAISNKSDAARLYKAGGWSREPAFDKDDFEKNTKY